MATSYNFKILQKTKPDSNWIKQFEQLGPEQTVTISYVVTTGHGQAWAVVSVSPQVEKLSPQRVYHVSLSRDRETKWKDMALLARTFQVPGLQNWKDHGEGYYSMHSSVGGNVRARILNWTTTAKPAIHLSK